MSYSHSIVFHVVVIGAHEQDVDHDTEGDEQFSEGVKHDDGQHLEEKLLEGRIGEIQIKFHLCCPDPEPATIPDTHHVRGPLDAIKHDVFHLRTLIIIILERHSV